MKSGLTASLTSRSLQVPNLAKYTPSGRDWVTTGARLHSSARRKNPSKNLTENYRPKLKNWKNFPALGHTLPVPSAFFLLIHLLLALKRIFVGYLFIIFSLKKYRGKMRKLTLRLRSGRARKRAEKR